MKVFTRVTNGNWQLCDKQLCRDAKIDTIPEHQKYVCIVFDEVKVKEDLIYKINILLKFWVLFGLENKRSSFQV